MKIIFNTDNGPITIDPDTISQFFIVSTEKTTIEYEADGINQTSIVNHDMHQVATCVLGITGQQP